jgi:para-aminobenzoate synthetase/4-amino-4-deoxychorismate lyase
MLLRFDFATPSGTVEPIEFVRPRRVIDARQVADVAPALSAVDDALADGLFVAGFVAYEAAPGLDPALVTQPSSNLPLVWFGVFDAPSPAPPLVDHGAAPDLTWTTAVSRDEHARGVSAIREAIADGDTYQINYTFRQHAHVEPAALPALYASLARAAQAPDSALIDTGGWRLLSLSPELFFRIDHGRLVTQPMKGTAPRGLWPADDAARAAALAASEKNRAENVMIVDLARNDITRVADIGTVQATTLFHVDRYPSVLQMVSTVEGNLSTGTPLSAVFRALFPAGSITGAPKSSSMRLIAALEHAPRGAYCGAIGFASPDGRAVFNVAIRTVTVAPDGAATYGVGGGITWDSEAGDEYNEAISKAACLIVRPDFELLETFRAEQGVVVRFAGHLERMRESARYFGFPFDDGRVRRAVADELGRHPTGLRRVRLRVNRDGVASVESVELEPPSASRPLVVLSDLPVDARDKFLYHKTTARQVYEDRAARHPGVFDVLLWNEDGHVTEFTRGNVVVELGGVAYTPPRSSGLLAGVLRGELIARGEIIERVITRDDLQTASKIWFVNSLRGRIDVVLSDAE